MENLSALNELTNQNHVAKFIKLSNGEIIDPFDFNRVLKLDCHYVGHIVVTGNNKPFPLALIFPDPVLFSQPDYFMTPLEGCFCPRDINEFGRCLAGCMRMANNELNNKIDHVDKGVIINDASLFKNGKVILSDEKILEKYTALIVEIYKGNTELPGNVYFLNSNQNGRHL